jgi:CheY-like chemotaxis protein
MDDEQIILKSTSMILRHLGYDVVTADNGEEAIELFRQSYSSDNPVDIAILDLTVSGGMGGKECIRHIKRIVPDVEAIVSSGFSNDSVMAHYREYGFEGVLPKPYSVGSLADAVRIVLQDRYRPGPNEEGFYRE